MPFTSVLCATCRVLTPLFCVMMMRTAVMTCASLALTAAVVAHAYYLKNQFYPTVVYLTKSSPSMAVSTTRQVKTRGILNNVKQTFHNY